jgi:CPA1 family monovalent cation:H+ antiporter
MIPQLIGQALTLIAIALFGLILAKLTRIDKTICCLGSGFVAGLLVAPLGFDTGIRAGMVQDLVFYLFLPPLIFQAAWHISPNMLRRWAIPIVIFSTMGVAMSVVVSGVLIYLGINHPGFPWIAALLTATMLAATDPVSVVNLLRTEKAPEDVAMLVEGESLFNDAVAVLLFTVILSLALSNNSETPEIQIISVLAFHILGGILAGITFGLIVAILVLFLKSSVIANLLLVVSAFGGFYIAQEFLGVPGIITVAITALVTRSALRNFEKRFLQDTENTWDWLGDTFIALIFVLMGIVIVPSMFIDQWLAILIAIVAALFGRAATVYICAPLSSLLMRHRSIPANWNPLLVWGGIRGAIAIALVLSLPLQLEYWYTVQSMVFGVVLFNLLIQGTTCRPFIRRLRKIE